jgi:acetolactate synthase I/II/III large subunit
MVQAWETTAEALVRGLVAHGVNTVFGIPGVQTYALFDALAGARDELRVIGARHEQALAYMAFGYAQASGRLGVYSVVPGPGVLNSAAALISAYGASQPVLCLTAEIPSAYIGRGLGHLHELPDQLATLRTLTKWAERVTHSSQAGPILSEAIYQATSGRPRPVAVTVPWDVLETCSSHPKVEVRQVVPPALDPEVVRRAAALVSSAKNPMIMVGGGARDAAPAVRSLAEFLQAPVVSFRGGKGVVSDEHPLALSCAEGFDRWADTDLVIGIGSRLELKWFRWPDPPPGLKLINIDIDPLQADRLEPAEAIVADAREGAEALLRQLCALGVPRAESRADEFVELKRSKSHEIRDIGLEIEYLDIIREELPRDGYLVEELCQAGFTSYFAFPVYEPRHFITCGHQGTLGFGFPTALGVKVAQPKSPVISIAGDGGFMFGVQELATAVQYGINVVVVVFDNHAFGNVLMDQRRLFGPERVLGAELTNPDFVALAKTMGAAGFRATNPFQFRTALRRALQAGRPAVISVAMELGQGESPFKYLTPASRKVGDTPLVRSRASVGR